MSIRVSCVIYRPDEKVLRLTLQSLKNALDHLHHLEHNIKGFNGFATQVAIDLIDNTSPVEAPFTAPWLDFVHDLNERFVCRLLQGHGNIGFGGGHNLSLSAGDTRYHLILNPDVVLSPNCLWYAIQFMEQHPEVVLLSPESRDPRDGSLQYQCKGMPTLLDLALRLLNSGGLNRCFQRRLAHYEERVRIEAGALFEPQLVSGCFMLFRTEALQSLGGFDPRFFMYFEDFDLSLRAHQLGKVVYHPAVKIQHHGGGAGRKGLRHILMFLKSATTFFRIHGWRIF